MTPPSSVSQRSSSGRIVVGGIIAVGLCLAAFAFWFQWIQTRRCLAFFGSDVATSVNAAPRVELWRLAPGSGPRRLVVTERRDISLAPGLVHLRHALVEDASFDWQPADAAPPPPPADWSLGIAFWRRGNQGDPTAVLAFDLRSGVMTVVGRPGRVALGRLGSGLATWVELVAQDRAPAVR